MKHILIALCLIFTAGGFMKTAFSAEFNGLNMSLGNLSRLSKARTRSISPENFAGEKGRGGMAKVGEGSASNAARDLGQGWKVNPYIHIKLGETATLAEIDGPGAIQQIWMTPAGNWRYMIIRFYWDDEKEPSIECPVGDFFACGWGKYSHVNSLPVCVNPGSAFNCYWEMPFRKKCRITMENISEKQVTLYYQINYTLTEIPDDTAYFHAQFRRTNPLPYKEVYTILDGARGWGHFVGTYMCWGVNNNGWWGEGEIKFFMDGDAKFPTICGTGTEDYFCGSYCFLVPDENGKSQYTEYSTAYAGMPQVIRPDGVYSANTRFSLYRWHIMDPIRFEKDLKVTIQALGWRSGGRYLPLQDDISSVAFWYQTEPHAPFPQLPNKDYLEIQ
ncbi:glycoside hydrolase family 172 protein [Candidatus Latescibacterota bacterium]